MKKCAILFLCVLACAVSPVLAVGIDSVLEGALANSETIRNLEITKENSSIASQISELEDETSVTVDTGSITLSKSDQASLSMQPSVSVSIAGVGDDASLVVGVSSSTSLPLGDGERNSTVTPNVEYSKSFDLSGFIDDRDDLVKQSNALQRELNYAKGVLEFKNSVINSVISIINTKISIETTKSSLENARKDYESDLALGVINEGSLSDMKSKMEISKLETSLEGYTTTLETLKRGFYNDYGIEYEDVDQVGDANLEVKYSSDGNTTVRLAELSLRKAQSDLDAKTKTGDSLRLTSAIQAPVVFSSAADTKASVKAGVGAEVSGSNYKVSASANAVYDGDELSPSLTISGSWSSKSNAKATDLEVLSLQNELLLAQMSYDEAKRGYDETVKSLEVEARDLKSQIAAFEVEAQYNQKVLEYTTTLYGKGMASQSEMEDAQAAVSNDEAMRIVYALKALVLGNRIEMNEL